MTNPDVESHIKSIGESGVILTAIRDMATVVKILAEQISNKGVYDCAEMIESLSNTAIKKGLTSYYDFKRRDQKNLAELVTDIYRSLAVVEAIYGIEAEAECLKGRKIANIGKAKRG